MGYIAKCIACLSVLPDIRRMIRENQVIANLISHIFETDPETQKQVRDYQFKMIKNKLDTCIINDIPCNFRSIT